MPAPVVTPSFIIGISPVIVSIIRRPWWRHVTDSNEPNLIYTAVAKVSHFKVSKVNKVAIFLRNVMK